MTMEERKKNGKGDSSRHLHLRWIAWDLPIVMATMNYSRFSVQTLEGRWHATSFSRSNKKVLTCSSPDFSLYIEEHDEKCIISNKLKVN